MASAKLVLGTLLALGIIIIAATLVVTIFSLQLPLTSPAPTPPSVAANVTITLYAGEINTSSYAFGNSSSTLSVPGPSLTVPAGSIVKVTLVDVGSMDHAWVLVNSSTSGPEVFGAAIASGSDPLTPGKSDSVTFTASTPGTYYYICPVDDHVGLGMWGTFTVS